MKSKQVQPQYLTIAGRRLVVLEENDYHRLARRADAGEPPLPEPDAQGNYPGLEALGVLLARKVLRRRRALGISQKELALRAGIRPETLNRIEQGKHKPSVPTIDKLDRALQGYEKENRHGK